MESKMLDTAAGPSPNRHHHHRHHHHHHRRQPNPVSTNPRWAVSTVTESKADLVASMEMASTASNGSSASTMAAAADVSGVSDPAATTTFTFSSGCCPCLDWARYRRWTKLEKMLVFLCVLLLVALVAVAAVALTMDGAWTMMGRARPDVCMSQGCVSEAARILQNMDGTADPCQDFYQYSCGGFEKRYRIPDDRMTWSNFDIIKVDVEQKLRDILEEEDPAGDEEEVSDTLREAKRLYRSCMDVDRLEAIGMAPLTELLEELGGWPVVEGQQWDENNFDWENLTYAFRARGLSTNLLFSLDVMVDIRNSSWRTLAFDEPSLGLSREYFVMGENDTNVRYYFDYMVRTATLLGADEDKAREELKGALRFEKRMAEMTLPQEERRDDNALYHPMLLREMDDELGSLVRNWTDYVNGLGVEDVKVTPSERVIVLTPAFLSNLTEHLSSTPKRDVANYLLWRAAASRLSLLNAAAREAGEEYSRRVTGVAADRARWKTCVTDAADTFSAAVGKRFVQLHFDASAKKVMEEMVEDIKQELGNILSEITWMDAATKARARAKLSSIRNDVGYPDEILEEANLDEFYSGLEMDADKYFENVVRVAVWSDDYVFGRLREKVDKTDWRSRSNPAMVNAFYSPTENSIQFPAGILQGTFFRQDRPTYMNYGGVGWAIGHEITHGFDDQGRLYDEEGNLNDWWDSETTTKFLQRAQCIIAQYGNYSAAGVGKDGKGMALNGVNTQGENIADNGGIKEAYRAYESWVSRHGEEPLLPGLESLNTRQLFWLSAANDWCFKYRPKALEQTITVDVHAPGRFRIVGSLANSLDFARDFDCPLGTGMNPVDKCQVW